MRKILLNVTIMMLLVGCSLQDVNIEKNESEPQETNAVESITVDKSEKLSEPEDVTRELRPDIGEKFIPEGMVDSGGYLTVDSAEIFNNLNDAGITEAQLINYSLLCDGEPQELFNEITKKDSIAYDKNTGDMINGWKIVKVHYTFENQSAVSIVNDYVVKPEEKYAEDIFTIGNLNVCNTDNSLMVTKMNYFCYNQIYFSLSDSVECMGKPDSTLFKCPVGEKVEFDIAYVFCCDPENLYMSATTGNKASTMVDLELGGDS